MDILEKINKIKKLRKQLGSPDNRPEFWKKISPNQDACILLAISELEKDISNKGICRPRHYHQCINCGYGEMGGCNYLPNGVTGGDIVYFEGETKESCPFFVSVSTSDGYSLAYKNRFPRKPGGGRYTPREWFAR